MEKIDLKKAVTEIKEEIKADFKPRKPDFKGDGVAVWVNRDKHGEDYLAIKIAIGKLGVTVNAFKPKD